MPETAPKQTVPEAALDHFEDDDGCWNCDGSGYVYSCFTAYECIDPEGGCDLCERRCAICNQAKRKA